MQVGPDEHQQRQVPEAPLAVAAVQEEGVDEDGQQQPGEGLRPDCPVANADDTTESDQGQGQARRKPHLQEQAVHDEQGSQADE